jgi:hypothetical protein
MPFSISPSIALGTYPKVNKQLLDAEDITPGTYFSTNLTVDEKGLITYIENGSGSTQSVFPNAPPPTVPASAGAIFVSDGSGSELLNTLYYRKESDGPIIPLLSPPDEVLVTQLSDFPTPVSSIITLDPTKIYRIAGTIDLGTNVLTSPSQILIRGGMPNADKLTKNDGTPMFVSTSGFTIRIQDINLENASGPIFLVDGLIAPTSDVILSNIIIENSLSFGNLVNLHDLEIDRVNLESCANGIVISGTNNYINFTQYNIHNPTFTLTALQIIPGTTMNSFFIKDCAWEINAGQTGLNIDPTVVITDPPGRIDNIAFIGTSGTPLVGITQATPSFEFFENVGILNSVTAGSASFSLVTPISVVISALNTYVPIQTTPPTNIYSLSLNSQRFSLTSQSNGELTYIGVRPHNLHISCYASVSVASGTKNIAMALYVDEGSGYIQCQNSIFYIRATGNPSIILSNCFVKVNTGAKFQVRVAQVSGSLANIDVNTVRLDIVSSGL